MVESFKLLDCKFVWLTRTCLRQDMYLLASWFFNRARCAACDVGVVGCKSNGFLVGLSGRVSQPLRGP